MPQLHYYVPNEVAEIVKQKVQATDLSLTRYLAIVVKHELISDWPAVFFEVVGGGIVGRTSPAFGSDMSGIA